MKKEIQGIIEKHFTVGSHKAETVVDEIFKELENWGRSKKDNGDFEYFKLIKENPKVEIVTLRSKKILEYLKKNGQLETFEQPEKEEVESQVFWICNKNLSLRKAYETDPIKNVFTKGYVYRERYDGCIKDSTGEFSINPNHYNFTKINEDEAPVVASYVATVNDKEIHPLENYVGEVYLKDEMNGCKEVFPGCKFTKIKKIMKT